MRRRLLFSNQTSIIQPNEELIFWWSGEDAPIDKGNSIGAWKDRIRNVEMSGPIGLYDKSAKCYQLDNNSPKRNYYQSDFVQSVAVGYYFEFVIELEMHPVVGNSMVCVDFGSIAHSNSGNGIIAKMMKNGDNVLYTNYKIGGNEFTLYGFSTPKEGEPYDAGRVVLPGKHVVRCGNTKYDDKHTICYLQVDNNPRVYAQNPAPNVLYHTWGKVTVGQGQVLQSVYKGQLTCYDIQLIKKEITL